MKLVINLLWCVLILWGCNTFKPRATEPPTVFSGKFEAFGDVLDTLRIIYINGRTDNLAGLLSDTYHFEADSLDSMAIGASLRSWDKARETQLTATILSDTSQRILVNGFNYSEAILFSSPDSVIIEWRYLLTRKDNTTLRGYAHFTLVRLFSRFYLTDWKDRQDPAYQGSVSWGRWKMEHLQ